MSNEDQRVRFINATMKSLNNVSDDLYEALMDGDTHSIVSLCEDIDYITKDLIQTFSDEI